MIALYRDINGRLVRGTIYHVFEKTNKFGSEPEHKDVDKIRSAYESRRRAFSLASLKLLENPDMNTFITLTYDPKKTTDPKYLDDLKNLFRGTGAKYLATFEKHKNNPNLHIHLITNADLDYYINDNGYYSCRRWHRGFSSVKFLSDTDDQFVVSKYIFKYMTKSEKVMHKFVYSSRGLLTDPEYIDIDLSSWCEEYNNYIINNYLGGLQTEKLVITSNYHIIKGDLYAKHHSPGYRGDIKKKQ